LNVFVILVYVHFLYTTLETEVKLFAQCSTEIKPVAIVSQLAHLKKKKDDQYWLFCDYLVWYFHDALMSCGTFHTASMKSTWFLISNY